MVILMILLDHYAIKMPKTFLKEYQKTAKTSILLINPFALPESFQNINQILNPKQPKRKQ